MLKKKLLSLLLIFILLFSFTGCANTTNTQQPSKTVQTQQVNNIQTQQTNKQKTNQTTQQQTNKNTNTSVSGKPTVTFIDVGQGDSILIQAPSGKAMLIDAGVPEMGSKVVNYIKSRGISKIDVLIGTHPHADHIGGIPKVIKNFEIGKFYMPKVTTTTKTFENVLRAAKSKGLSINVAKAGLTLDLGEGIKAEMIAPNSAYYDDLNNYSAVIKVTYGNTAFMFTGDAEKESEQEMLSRGYNLKTDVFKVGHHGSLSSSTWAFLKAVSPKYAVISVGKNNDYGHPHKEIIEKLKSLGVIVYRTDECGTVVAVSDGKTISFNVKPGDYTASSKTFQSLPYGYYGEPGKIYVDSNGRGLIKGNINSKGEKIYHIPGDPWYNKTKAEVWFKTEAEAQAAGFRPPKK
ncbi:MAG: beta-lactamase protein [Defluviitaleaceae bacterium]|jgi:beta-lactamase superfamily II metal-dependent hydrolase|nr:beta-lactamase protein [Defluviitaleaceae bacterium]